jgi:hypothetical protein
LSADSAFEHTVIPQKDLALELTARAAFTQGGDVNPKMYVVNRRKSYSFTTEKSHSQRGVLVAEHRVLPSRIDCTDPHVVSSLGRRNS